MMHGAVSVEIKQTCRVYVECLNARPTSKFHVIVIL